MDILNIFIVLILGFCESVLTRLLAGTFPYISVQDGNLRFVASDGRNISFETTSRVGGVWINNMDVLITLNKAHNATKLIDRYQNLFSTYDDRMEALEQRVSEAAFTQNRTNISGVSEFTNRRFNRRLTLLLRRYNELRSSLLNDDCANNPCKNGGRCQDMFENYACQCQEGWEGPDCVVDVNECSKFVGTDLGCQNGATCINKPGTYECLCPSGFVGIHCNRRKVDCTLGGTELCGHGTCVPQNNPVGYKCICDQGWTTDGTNVACIADVNECSQNHPACSAHPPVPCINVPGSYYCGACPQGYTGNGYFCADIDECAINNGGCSVSPLVLCTNTLGSRTCGLCPPGYAGNGITCTFRGICNVDNGGCHHLAQCRDNPHISSTFVECICPAGYIGSGKGPNGCVLSSSALNPCAPNPCLFGDCSTSNVTRDYICHCRRRYTGRNCDILKDPCASNPCLNGGTCQNLAQLSYKCICATGFVGTTCDTEAEACGGILQGLSGTLKYPPGDYATYDHRVSCAWIIETNASKILDINFKKFNTENSTGCRFDWLQIHDGRQSASRALGKFCGDKLPLGGKILSTHNAIYLWFRSDGRTDKSGFELTWNSTNPQCGGNYFVTTSYGSLASPGTPGVYPLNRDCYWRLLVPVGKRFYFHFYSLQIGENVDCNSDYLEFYVSALYREKTTFAKFCNSSEPSPFYSPGNTARIHFHSDNKDSYPGFQLTYSVISGIPGCGGVYTANKGTIESVQPQEGPNYLCEYKIQQLNNSKIKITFLSLNLHESPSCMADYIEVREGPNSDSPLVGRYCDTLPAPYVSLTNELTIISSTSKDSKGWKIKYETVCMHKFGNATGSFQSSPTWVSNCIYRIERPVGSVIELVLKSAATPFLRQRFCNYNFIEVRDGDDENANLIGKYCQNVSEVITSTYNHLWIRVNSRRFEASYTSIDKGCGGVLKDKVGNIASPTHPEGYYPPHSKCTWVIIAPSGNIIQLTWLTFNLEQSYECTYDNVRVYDNNTEPGLGGLMGPYCGSTRPPILMSSSNIMTIVFTTDVTINMDGFLASYTFIPETKVCGGNYFTSAGVIKSPGYPKEYPHDRECTWTITVPRGQQIMLNVSDFNIESYSSCIYDWLEIRNGGTSASPLIDRYCGTKIPKQIPSHSNQLYLFFKSDINRSGHGFKINWFSTSTGCGGILTSPIGSIISPNYPEPYGRNTECMWKIIISAGSRVQLVFADINLETHNHCSADYVQLFDGLTTNSKSLGKYCISGGSPILSTGNQMLVKFRSDAAYQGRGFQLHYVTVCKNTVKGFRGIIESPNFPNNYPQDQDCTWDIKVSDKNKINITFSHFDLERASFAAGGCNHTYMEVKYARMEEGDDEDTVFDKLNEYCSADSIPGLITVDSDHAQIHFVSDKLIIGTGFRLEWQIFGCGGLLTHRTGTIQSPNYPKAYPPLIKCEWQIQVDFGYSIEIEFKEIDVEKNSCEYDSIKVYNGPDNTFNLLATLCHQVKPVVISSTGNFMFVEFTSDYSYHGRGFTANYSTISTKCGGRFTAPAGTIFTPNYPKNYDKNDTCYWLIDVDENHSIELYFEDVDLYQTNCQQYNYIKVYDGPTAAYPVLETICGNNKPNRTITSTFNEMFIEFRSNIYIATKGFSAKYRKACGSRITTQGTGTIKVEHNEMSDISNCTWTIVSTDPSRHVALTISHIVYMNIYYDEQEEGSVIVYGGESVNSPLIGTYSGQKTPPTIVSDGSAITISLTREMDFFATYSVLDSYCGGTLITGGYFASPGYPKTYAFDTQCEWTIQVAPGNHLTLSFIYFELLESEHCNTDYLEIRKNNSTGKLLGIYCGKNKPDNITHEGNMWLMYKGSKRDPDAIDIKAKGFYGEFSLDSTNELSGPKGVIASPLYPSTYHNYGSTSWKITVATGKRILITFKEFYMESNEDDESECYFSSLTIYDGVDDTARSIALLCGQIIPDPVKTSSNIVFIQIDFNSVRMGSKFVLEWLEISNVFQPTTDAPPRVAGCGSPDVIQINTLHNYTITSPGYPEVYKPSLNCDWIFSTTPGNHLIIYFLNVDLKNYVIYGSRAQCNADYITLYQKSSLDNDWKLLKTICSREDYYNEFIHSTDLLKVNFVTNRYLSGTGFKAEVLEGCGGLLTESTGYIIFNNSTLRSSECQWNITVRSGRTIELTFEEMNIAHNENKGCNFYLMIRNGQYPDSPLLGDGKYCGTDLPDPLKSTGNYLYLKYSGLPNIVGFRLKYKEISSSCGGEIKLTQFDRSAEISSLNYPNIPPPHSECLWTVSGPPGESFRVEFEERFDLTSTNNCEIEYVELRDGGTEFSPLIGRFCKDIPSTQFSTGNIMLIKFFTNTEDPKNGFKAKITLAYCGGTIRGREGEIKSPTLQTGITQNQNCTWRIIGPANHYLNLWFTKLKTKWLRHCFPTSLITISEIDRVSNTVNKMGEYCGTTLPALNRSVGNEVIVNYLGDNNDNFILKFNASRAECGGTLKQESGTIQSPGYPKMEEMSSCTWKIEVPEGRHVTLNIEDFDLDENAHKHDQVLMVFDGSDKHKIRLAYLKPGDPTQIIESSSNKMQLQFWCINYSNRRGFKASFSSNQPTICDGDFSGQNSVLTQPMVRNNSYSCRWKHTSDNLYLNETLALTVSLQTNFTQKNSAICSPYVTTAIFVANQDNSYIVPPLCKPTSNHIIRSPFYITQIIAQAEARLQMNFTIAYNIHQCGGIINRQTGYISSPNFPNKPSKTFECAWLLKVEKDQTINLTVVNDNLGNDCEKSFLSIYNGDLPTHPRIGKYCHNTKIEPIISQGNSLWLEYKWETGSSGTGFKLKYEAVQRGCGGIYHYKSRLIETPNYGNDYPNNAECLWEIRASPGHSIRLKFIERFHLEDSDNCKNDYVEFWDWKDDKWISVGKRCGRNVPADVQSTGEKLKILFRSNNKTTGSGFKAEWDWTCGGTFEATKVQRYIVSPGYPIVYPGNLNCVYNITSASDVLILRFDDFEVENGPSDCRYDNVTIVGQYFLPRAFPKNSYCGTNKPPTQRMKGNVIITFKTDNFVNKKGFKFMYSDESCGGEVNEETVIESQMFNDSSPSEFRFYRPRIKCVWKITAPDNKIVILRVKELKMMLTPMCFAQNVMIYNGLAQNYTNRLGTLCADITEGEPIAAESGKMLVTLDASPYNYGGFKAEVYFSHGPNEGCGGTIYLNTSITIQPPNLEDLDCVWKIRAPRDYQIHIRVTDINIPESCTKNNSSEKCTCSYIQLRDGAGPISNLIEKLCSSSNRYTRNFTTSWNTAYIRFFLRGRQNNAFKAILTPILSLCGHSILNATEEIKTLTSPNYPNKYPTDINCNWVFNAGLTDKVVLHFVDFDLTEQFDINSASNDCFKDRVEIFEDPNNLLITEGLGPNALYVGQRRSFNLNYNDVNGRHIFCGKNESTFDYYSSGKSITLAFKSVDSQNKGRGFKLEYSKAGCNRNYTSLQGRVVISERDKSDCIITITVPENRTITLYFQQFFITYTPNCTDTAFEVKDNGPTGTELLKSCGYRTPNPVFSNSSKLYIRIFHKNPILYRLRRFDFLYTSTKYGRGCGGTIYNYKGRFTSPLYPNEFRNESICTWDIRVPVGLQVALKLISFDLQGDCDQNYLIVTTYLGDLSTDHKFCKRDRPSIMRSSTSRMQVKYSSSIHNGGTGWMALFQGVTEGDSIS